jgi:5-methyltetrahydrofolate--homocysteine methyltransferase
MGFSEDTYVPDEQWRFIPATQLASPDLRRHYVTTNWNTYIRGTSRIHRFHRNRKDLWVAGPDDEWLRANRINVRRETSGLREIGRYDRDQLRDLEGRARGRRREYQDRRRREAQVRREREAQMRREEQERQRELHKGKQQKPLLPYAEANRRRPALVHDDLPAPAFVGRRVLQAVPLADLIEAIDWTFFFTAWELRGRYPAILDHPQAGPAARELHAAALALLDEIVRDGSLTASGVYGFWPAASDGNDVVLYSDASRQVEAVRFNMLRQQQIRSEPDKPMLCLADFVAPAGDHVGAFAVTAGLGADELAARYARSGDDYSSIIVKALADRLAEAFAETLHARVRREWGYATDENLSPDDLIAERYRGIRPAFGYPACPDHSEKRKLFELLEAGEVGLRLTETCAMWPAASVSGIYLAHPEARYFLLGRIGRDQVEDYAARKGLPIEEVQRWLAPSLAYDPR